VGKVVSYDCDHDDEYRQADGKKTKDRPTEPNCAHDTFKPLPLLDVKHSLDDSPEYEIDQTEHWRDGSEHRSSDLVSHRNVLDLG
jgi:hypothetical protein